MHAARYNYLRDAIYLDEDPDDRDNPEHTLLILIKAGANLNLQNHEGQTALIQAVKSGSLYRTRALIKAGADLDLKDNAGKTALQYATERDLEDIEDLLLESGAK